MLHARALLQTTDEDLTGVAIDTGFSSQSHFTETFRRQIGTTPRRYRDATCGRR
ncbi:MAG: AraC family transcriptional regulator [Gammaproteobacteria bacterium]